MTSRIVLLYGTFGSSNRGCDALTISMVDLVKKHSAQSSIVAYCSTARPGRELDYLQHKDLRIKGMPGKNIHALREFIADLKRSELVIDLSAGDGFSDIYSFRFMCGQVFHKWLAVAYSKKYVLAPQTIGPFHRRLSRLGGKFILKRAKKIYARDILSAFYVNLLDGELSPGFCPDLAFYMNEKPPEVVPKCLSRNMVGINVSGLLWREAVKNESQFGFNLSYKTLCIETVKYFISQERDVVLIPHDYTTLREFSADDLEASRELIGILKQESVAASVSLLDEEYTAYELKWIISQLDFFIGARMHACIGAVSTGTPFLAFAYSRKFIGLFGSMGLGDLVIQLQTNEGMEGVLRRIQDCYEARGRIKGLVHANTSGMTEKLEGFAREVLA